MFSLYLLTFYCTVNCTHFHFLFNLFYFVFHSPSFSFYLHPSERLILICPRSPGPLNPDSSFFSSWFILFFLPLFKFYFFEISAGALLGTYIFPLRNLEHENRVVVAVSLVQRIRQEVKTATWWPDLPVLPGVGCGGGVAAGVPGGRHNLPRPGGGWPAALSPPRPGHRPAHRLFPAIPVRQRRVQPYCIQ